VSAVAWLTGACVDVPAALPGNSAWHDTIAQQQQWHRVHKDGESITVNFPKEESSGVINNQLESSTFKVCGL